MKFRQIQSKQKYDLLKQRLVVKSLSLLTSLTPLLHNNNAKLMQPIDT